LVVGSVLPAGRQLDAERQADVVTAAVVSVRVEEPVPPADAYVAEAGGADRHPYPVAGARRRTPHVEVVHVDGDDRGSAELPAHKERPPGSRL
jgi:hypothetical protein